MADIQSFLTRKAGPLPVWGWAAAGGGLISVLWLARRGQSSSASSSTGQAQPNVPYVPSPIIVTPGNMPNSTSSVNPSPPPTTSSQITVGARAMVSGNGQPVLLVRMGGDGIWAPDGYLPDQSIVTVTGPPVSATWSSGEGNRAFMAVPINFAGRATFTNAIGLRPLAAGMGGFGAGAMNFVPGSGGGKLLRHTGPHAHPQYVGMGGMGGGGGHQGGGHQGMQGVSKRTGVPMSRLMSLNPGQWHPRRQRPAHIHIA